MWAKGSRWYLALTVLMMVAGCVPLQPYHAEPDKVAIDKDWQKVKISPNRIEECYDSTKWTCALSVEYDDFGNLYSRKQLDDVTGAAEYIARNKGIVVVYVHGWHHNADEQDTDLLSFRSAINHTSDLGAIDGDVKRKILAIYVGWRGKSVDLTPFNYLSFWDRKNTAQAVGDGAVFELFRKLANWRERYKQSRLVIVGHSFGAAVTYASVARSITDQIIDDPYPGEGVEGPTENERKRWDMVVLVNPAIEAMQLRAHFELARSRNYKSNQLPHLMIVTTDADWATKHAFFIGRRASTIFNNHFDHESDAMNTIAVGHYTPYITHQLAVNEPHCFPGTQIATTATVQHIIHADNYCFGDKKALKLNQLAQQVHAVHLTRCDPPTAGKQSMCSKVAGNHHLTRGPDADVPEFMPIMNIRTTKEVMEGHSDIWNPTMQGFLVQMLLMTVADPKTPKDLK